MTRHLLPFAGLVLIVAAGVAAAQAPDQAPASSGGLNSRRTTAVAYEARRTTKVDMVGTPLQPRARGEAEIKTESAGPVQIKAMVRGLGVPSTYGPEYLTYVFWAIPPQGRPKNLGEGRVDGDEAEIESSTDVQAFALVVTAEPYYAVTTPSEVVVMENAIREDTRGRTAPTTLQYEIVPKGAYVAAAGGSYALPAPRKNEPPDVQQARNAVAIAQLAQADKYAETGLTTAKRILSETEALVAAKKSSRDIISGARAAAQAAEESRLQAVTRRAEEEQRLAREAAAAREQAARDEAARQAAAAAAAEQQRVQAEQQRAQAEQAARELAAEKQRADEARAEAEKLRAEAQSQAAQADALRAKAEQDQAQLRATLLRQFSEILDTKDSPRGLIVNIGDVLFETGRFELKPPAREKLARFAGIVLAHEGLNIQAEGFTDSTGTLAVNEKLSQQRADSVASYLMTQGVARDRIASRGLGPSQPVASNDTREGRSQNRRVELIVAGDVIGTPIGTGTSGR